LCLLFGLCKGEVSAGFPWLGGRGGGNLLNSQAYVSFRTRFRSSELRQYVASNHAGNPQPLVYSKGAKHSDMPFVKYAEDRSVAFRPIVQSVLSVDSS
jgi:hypothetical protein